MRSENYAWTESITHPSYLPRCKRRDLRIRENLFGARTVVLLMVLQEMSGPFTLDNLESLKKELFPKVWISCRAVIPRQLWTAELLPLQDIKRWKRRCNYHNLERGLHEEGHHDRNCDFLWRDTANQKERREQGNTYHDLTLFSPPHFSLVTCQWPNPTRNQRARKPTVWKHHCSYSGGV